MPVPRTSPTDEDTLELPPSDGDTGALDDDPALAPDDLDPAPADAATDPFDDATAEDDPVEADLDEAPDGGSALDDEETGVDDEPHDAPEMALTESSLGDEEPLGVHGEDFGIEDREGDGLRDGGEEGFDMPEPELRVEDLPRLDEGDDDELSVEEATDRTPGAQPSAAELRWDDRAFTRAAMHTVGHVVALRARTGLEVALADGSSLRSMDGGRTFSAADHVEVDDEPLLVRGRAQALLREGVGVLRTLGDGPLVPLESTAQATAFTLLEDGTVIAAIEGDRSLLVSIGADGACTLVADISMECDDEAAGSAAVEALVADERTGLVWAGGAFGLLAFRRR